MTFPAHMTYLWPIIEGPFWDISVANEPTFLWAFSDSHRQGLQHVSFA